MMRLSHYMSSVACVCSRRKADGYIQQGDVSVNGCVIREPYVRVGAEDRVRLKGRLLSPLSSRDHGNVLLYNKRPGYVVSRVGHKNIFDHIESLHPNSGRWVSVGRLDVASQGLMILTQDTAYAHFLQTSSFPRCYHVSFRGSWPQHALTQLRRGIRVGNMHYKPIRGLLLNANLVQLTLHEGKNREIRRIMQHFSCDVTVLQRISFGPYSLSDIRGKRTCIVSKRSMRGL